jgi:hypothetical protein
MASNASRVSEPRFSPKSAQLAVVVGSRAPHSEILTSNQKEGPSEILCSVK